MEIARYRNIKYTTKENNIVCRTIKFYIIIYKLTSTILSKKNNFISLFLGEFGRQVNDMKIRVHKMEQENTRLEGLVRPSIVV